MARTSHFLVRMLTFSPPYRALVGGARDIEASVIAPAPATEDGAARPAPATFVPAEAHLLSAAMSAGPIPATTRSLTLTGVSGA
jgi:hypothetical protein